MLKKFSVRTAVVVTPVGKIALNEEVCEYNDGEIGPITKNAKKFN